MKYLLILLMLGGEIVKGQTTGTIGTGTIDAKDVKVQWGPPIGAITYQPALTEALNRLDSCQRYRDSVVKYDYNIKVWQRRIGPRMTDLERISVTTLISNLRNQRKQFVQLAKKCKP